MDPSSAGPAQPPSPVSALAARCEHAALASPAPADTDALAHTAASPPPSSSASTPTPTLAPAAEPDGTVLSMATPASASAPTIAERRRRRSLRIAARTAANVGIGTPRSRGGRRMSTSSVDSAAGIVSPASTRSDSFSFVATPTAAPSSAPGVTSPGVTSLGIVSPGQLHAMSEDDTMDEGDDHEPMDVDGDGDGDQDVFEVAASRTLIAPNTLLNRRQPNSSPQRGKFSLARRVRRA
ncbi:hypothetical protein AMAG_08921 [Allomyces macrogynus ATCC 38327]|uniref:Uncharacterized protein n=1 Tax=Allomyces macrogynus (strain ATCC 38327) TaxID=578462 RepID=A0A0L0SMZ6_ALLM3|nr:hypothetical protein AMAG_08921 [Allomyces macrogynus ATCC 38327]|eukprot:KNE63857.1 hypothetical protein AMAG_08921 [Allomyces macrogynus ATCC 38327]